ncbi:MAG: prohibitin family protein [Pseudomonadota bacterium]
MKSTGWINTDPVTGRTSLFGGWLLKGVIALLVLLLLGSSFFTVDQGERAVLLRNGKLIAISEPGLGFKLPIIDEIVKISVQSRLASYESMVSYSRDQQPATMRVSVNYRINPGLVDEIYSDYGNEFAMRDRLITPRVQQEVKTVFGQFTAVSAIQERERLNLEALVKVQASVGENITIEAVQIENIDFSQAYEQSIEQRMLAEVEVQKVRQNLERERIQAEILETQAMAEANATRLRGEAEASAITARGQALRDNPDLIGLVQAEKWNGVLPTTMLPNGTVPILNMGKE